MSDDESSDERKSPPLSKTLDLVPIMTIVEEGKENTEEHIIARNIIHTEWLNNNFKELQEVQLQKILHKEGKGIYVISKYNPSGVYAYNWIAINDFKKKRIPEKYGNQIISMIEWGKPQSLNLFFCDKDSTMTLYHII